MLEFVFLWRMITKFYWTFFIVLFILVSSSCVSNKYLSRQELKELDDFLSNNPNFQQHHFGFYLKDLGSGQILKNHNASKYFTPASNTKILTLATGLELLGDSIPALKYYIDKDTLYIEGLGDPTLFHRDFTSQHIVSQINELGNTVVLDMNTFQDERYGEGWSWDDYNGAYQVERSALPLYGNVVRFVNGRPDIPFFVNKVSYHRDSTSLRIQRNRFLNEFLALGSNESDHESNIPIVLSDSLVARLLQDTLKKNVILGKLDTMIPSKLMYSHPIDSVLIPMMQDSDNFLADQILLMSSYQKFGYMNSKRIIAWAKDSLFRSPDEMLWIDGSGLSRYNLITPRSIVDLLESLYNKFGEERILTLLPKGGVSETIENWYASTTQMPYVFAKTGTLRNNHSLSGFLRGDSGRLFVFSFMNNNYPGGSSSVKKPMEQVLMMLKRSL